MFADAVFFWCVNSGDMTEHVDEASTQASRLAAMKARLTQLKKGIWT